MTGFVPPPYPYDRLDRLAKLCAEHDGGVVDLSIGTPCDPPPPAVIAALASSTPSAAIRPASARRRCAVRSAGGSSAGSMSTSRSTRSPRASARRSSSPPRRSTCSCARPVATPCCIRRSPTRPTRWARSWPAAARCRCRCAPTAGSTSMPIDPADIARALMLWVNSPSNPTGALTDLDAAAAWGRRHDVPGVQRRVLRRVHVGRAGAHDPRDRTRWGRRRALAVEAVEPRRSARRLLRRRRRAGHVPEGGAQARRACWCPGRRRPQVRQHSATTPTCQCSATAIAAGSSALAHGAAARGRASPIGLPAGGFYLWFDADDGWEFAERLAREGGALVSPGDFYGAGGANNVRVAVVQPDDRIELVAQRLGVQ